MEVLCADDSLAGSLTRIFRDSGFELYLVGGAVRSAVLGTESEEFDFATSALPDDTFRLISALPDARPFRVGEKFGTIGAVIGDQKVEITTYRSGEVYAPGSRKPSVEFGKTLLEDLGRRDFTINAIALDPLTCDIIDPLDGVRDLRAGRLRTVGDPAQRFAEDPLRLLRGVRFAARLELRIYPSTWRAMVQEAPRISTISRERVRDEYSRMLTGLWPSAAMTMLRDSGLLEHSVPQLMELTRMPDHGPRHPLPLWDHEMRVLEDVPATLDVRWAALLHDIAKPVTRTHEPSGRPRFFHHEEIGAEMAREILVGLKYPGWVVEDVALLVGSHMQLHAYSPEWSDGAVRRLMMKMGDRLDSAIALVRADAAGHSLDGTSHNSSKFDHLCARVEELRKEPPEQLKSPLSGDDLMARYNRSPGPWIREVKQALEDEVVEGRLAPGDVIGARALADRIVSELE